MDNAVQQISAKLGNTKQMLPVEVAGGDDHLNRAADFMDKQLWSRALDELENTPAFSKPDSEAYRQYDLGLVHEAMSYEAKTLADQKANLLEAQEYYDKALEMNRKEKYFVATVARTRDALARYKAFEGMQKEDVKASAAPTPAPAHCFEEVDEVPDADIRALPLLRPSRRTPWWRPGQLVVRGLRPLLGRAPAARTPAPSQLISGTWA